MGPHDDIERTLRRLAHASAYPEHSSVAWADDLLPILRHVVKNAENPDGTKEGKRHVSDALSILESVVKLDDIKLDSHIWVEICYTLQDITSRRYDNHTCKTLLYDEINRRLHLRALSCITHVVIYRLRETTPPEIQETLTAAAKLDGQEGREHRIVFGAALMRGLWLAIPDWYAKNEPLLFGEDVPEGMGSVLVRVCSQESTDHIDREHSVLHTQNMERYHAVVLEALGDEIRHMESTVGKPVRSGSPVGGRSVVKRRVWTNDLMRLFMYHVLFGSRGYDVEDSVRDLTRIGPYAICVASRECATFIKYEDTEKELVDRGVRFWKAVLESSPKPDALYGFGWWHTIDSIDVNTWERLMLRTCNAAGTFIEPTDMF